MNDNDQQNYSFNSKPRVKEKSVLLQKLVNLQYFINAFYKEQKQAPWKSLYGPGPSAQTNLSLIHLWYVFILSFIPVCSLMAGLGFVQPYLASDSTLCDWTSHPKTCESIIVLFITYRIGFAISIFFLFTSLLLLKTKSSTKSSTSTLHTGFWIEKIFVVLILSCVAFAFPPSIFDGVWLYFILIGDFAITCLQVFLLCDLVKDVHDYAASFIFKTKTKILWRSVLLFMEIIGPTCAIFTFSALTVYTVVTKSNCIFSIISTIISIIIVLLIVMYILCVRRCELLRSIYVVAYILFLVYKATVYRTVCDPNVVTPDIVSTDLKTTMPIVILYITLIYAMVRKDQITHFYYFYWVICCQQTEIERNIQKINETENNEPIRKQSDISHDIPYNKVNQNETLLDLSFQRTSSESVKPKQDDPSHESKTSKQLKVCYNETFIHILFFFISLKSTSLVSSYLCLHQQFDGLSIIKPTVSVISLQVTSLTACILYFWFLHCKYSKDMDPLWSTELVRSFFKVLMNIFYILFIKTPVCFRNNTLLSKYIYTIFYVCSFTLSCIVLTPSFRKHFENNSIFCENIAPLGSCISQDPSYVGLYRVMVTVGMFFFVLATLTINLKVTKNYRNDIQNGCWLLKAILLIAFFALFVNLSSKLSRVWLYLSLVATFIFTFVQLICLLDCVNIMQASWSNSTRLAPTTLYYSSTSLTTFLYLISTAAFVCFYIYFAQNFNCKVTRLFISINLVLCISASLISIHPAVKTGGLLRSAIVTSFCMYLTWTALNYNPNEKCNPLAHSIQMVESKPSRDAVSIIDTFFLVLTLIYYTIRIDQIIPTIKLLSPCYLLLCRCCKSTRKKRKTTEIITDPLTRMNEKFDDKGNVDLIERWLTNCQQQQQSLGDSNIYGQKLLFGLPNNNLDQVSNQAKSMTSNSSELADNATPYSYWWFHLVYFIATSYSFVLLTHWIEPIPGSAFQITVHWAIMCVRMVGSCCFVLLYIWTMVNPLLAHLYHYNRI